MAEGVVLETLSNRKLVYLTMSLLLLQITFYLIGGLIAPAPTNVQNILGTKCLDTGGGRAWTKWHYSRGEGRCEFVDEFNDPRIMMDHISTNEIVFVFQFPTPRGGHELDMSRWFQNIISVLQLDVEYNPDVQFDDNPVITMDARLGYKNKHDNHSDWTEIARSTEIRDLKCNLAKRELGQPIECDLLPFFELGSCHHDYYLINIRLPVDEKRMMNTGIGVLNNIYMIAIHPNGGFSKVWLSLKTCLFPTMLAVLIWFWHRVVQLPRPSNLLERMLLALGLTMAFLNLPVEWFTLWIYMPYMLLFSDIRQGIFHTVLLSFWIIFTGEHMMDQVQRNRLVLYWKHLGAVAFGCICLFVFELCERGVQLTNPFYSIWATTSGSKLGYAFVILASVAACVYFVFLCVMVGRALINIYSKRSLLATMSKARRKYYKGLIYRFNFLMMMTVVCAAITVIFFIIGQVSEGQWKWNENSLEYNSAFLTGVYGMWNVYVCCLLILYAPSHKTKAVITGRFPLHHKHVICAITLCHQNVVLEKEIWFR
ncbi:hypothetical protein NP493_213g03006 [Ridgeia piscesae]|uniref:Protein wntless n=1 Tax=Ridgeia piscesae TaxID=27915 RepID=A0AAD9UE61_RIDPI|nr:hypothetical protein NP493_213g03006 [Ridgeia piscesae]